MKNTMINKLLFAMFTSLILQAKAQDTLKTNYAPKTMNYLIDGFYIIKDKPYTLEKLSVENEYLIFLIRTNKTMLIDLTDNPNLQKIEDKKGADIIKINNCQIYYDMEALKKKIKYMFSYEYRNHANKYYVDPLYNKLLFHISHIDPKDKEEYRLHDFKTGNLNNKILSISEEQRKYIVQANAANENKDYENALELFQKAIEINPYTYPAAYFNMALIHANLDHYYQAMYNMKKYLIAAPDAEDARKAQDKIYEWELNIIK